MREEQRGWSVAEGTMAHLGPWPGVAAGVNTRTPLEPCALKHRLLLGNNRTGIVH